ncbi:MAG: sterol 14-demethylase [Polyangiales bacterium]|jgi:sterol 14-demethylase
MRVMETASQVLQSSLFPRRPEEKAPARLSREYPVFGHMAEFVRNPFELLKRAQGEGKELITLRLLHQDIVLVSGPEAHEAFFRAPDDQLCRREAYKLMTPIFGEGVIFDASPKRGEEQVRMSMRMLRDQRMRGYPPIISDELSKLVSHWGESGEEDILELMKEATIYASSRCLIGDEFRAGMSEEFHELYGHLEKGINPLAYIYPNAPLPSFRRRDHSRESLVARVGAIIEGRQKSGNTPDDGLQSLLDARYKDGDSLSPDIVTGILIAIMMAGHHTSAGTAAWTILELARRPDLLARVRAEVDAVFARDGELSYQGLRQMTLLHDVLKEVLRLHPPLIFLFRKVLRPFEHGGKVIPAGAFVCASPGVSHRDEEIFPNADVFDPDRYARDDIHPYAWIAFGGGKHKCTGNAFGLLQLKTIAATLLHQYDFSLSQPSSTYEDDYEKATIMPKQPFKLRYRKRLADAEVTTEYQARQVEEILSRDSSVEVLIDTQLCQGHSVCVSEAPQVFRISEEGEAELLPEAMSAAIYGKDAAVRSELYPLLERAYRHCPNSAIAFKQNQKSVS